MDEVFLYQEPMDEDDVEDEDGDVLRVEDEDVVVEEGYLMQSKEPEEEEEVEVVEEVVTVAAVA